MNTEQKTAYITGGMGGIGRAISEQLAQDGFCIAVLYHNTSSEEVDNFLSSLSGKGHKAFNGDITNVDDVERITRLIHQECGRIDVCIHAATEKLTRKKITDLDVSAFQAGLATDLVGGFNIFLSVSPIMQEQKSGKIIGILSSVIEPNAVSGKMGAYGVAKYGLRGLLREFAKELAPYGVTVNAIAPNFVYTSLQKDIPERALDFIREKNPMKKIVSPQDVARIISFLCSEAANPLTGISIPITYGEVMNL